MGRIVSLPPREALDISHITAMVRWNAVERRLEGLCSSWMKWSHLKRRSKGYWITSLGYFVTWLKEGGFSTATGSECLREVRIMRSHPGLMENLDDD